eukprot:scaffold23063_cov20-Tisochrysis_lutea.AAC.1
MQKYAKYQLQVRHRERWECQLVGQVSAVLLTLLVLGCFLRIMDTLYPRPSCANIVVRASFSLPMVFLYGFQCARCE